MKKPICAAVTALLLLCSVCSALSEVRAYYSQGMVTVVTDEGGLWEIMIDGENMYRFVGGAMRETTFSFPLEDKDEHTVTLISLQDGTVGGSAVIIRGPVPASTPEPAYTPLPTAQPPVETAAPAPAVTPAAASPVPSPAATAEQTPVPSPAPVQTAMPAAVPMPVPKGPLVIGSVSSQGQTLRITVSGLRGYAEIWIDKKNTGRIVVSNGQTSLDMPLPTGKHTLTLYAPAVNEIDSKTFQAVFEPDPDLVTPESLGNLIRRPDGSAEAYQVAWESSADENTLVLTAGQGNRQELSLYLFDGMIRQFLHAGFHEIRFVNGDCRLLIRLDQISPSWFGANPGIAYFVFTAQPLADGTVRLSMAGQDYDGETLPPVSVAGVRLIRNGQTLSVRENGVY